MYLTLNIAVYLSFVFSLYAAQKWWKLLNRIGVTTGAQLILALALTYIVMLVLQSIRDIKRGGDNSEVVRRGFYFSFFAGCGWAFLQFMGTQGDATPILFFYPLALFYGLCLGLVSIIIVNSIFGFRRL